MYKQKFKELNCCVIIPTYNNDATLANVIEGVLEYTDNVLVVNDGSTDSTSEILKKYSNIEIISYGQNVGKGWAMRKGFDYAREKDYRYAITIDSDGQHLPKDLPVFLEKIEKEPDSLIVGARNMEQDSIPGKSSFGHKFSNFWYRFETGINLPDTQSGYRLYPLEKIKDIHSFTKKYEYEVEIIVKAAWKGINVISCPIHVYYATGDERVTHFRPFQDFSRVSLLNTWLVFLALVWYRPVLFFRDIKKKTSGNSFANTYSVLRNPT